MPHITKGIPFREYCNSNNMSEIEFEILDRVINLQNITSLEAFTLIESIQDNVNQVDITVTVDSIPDHYTSNAIEPIVFITKWNLNFSEGNLVKYLSRYKKKLPVADLEKCKFYSCCVIEGNYDSYKSYKKGKK